MPTQKNQDLHRRGKKKLKKSCREKEMNYRKKKRKGSQFSDFSALLNL